MASLSQHPRRLFQWTVCAYRKPGMSEEDYHQYMSEKHAPLTHNTSETRKLLAKIAGPQFDNHAEYDSFVQAVFKDVEDFVRMKADPLWREVVAPDHENFADTKRSCMTVGWVEDHILDGKVVEYTNACN
ncbi:hypothetical protein MMC29_001731 [Sticta canariensis]|nr:hypothetical protein [Sticta canariensis]